MTRTMILSSTVNFATQAPKPAWRNPYEYSATEKYVFELVEFWQCVFFQTALLVSTGRRNMYETDTGRPETRSALETLSKLSRD